MTRLSTLLTSKKFILFILFICLNLLIWKGYSQGVFDPTFLLSYKENYPFFAIILFILIYIVSVFASLPSLPLNLAAGFFWGGLLGGIYSVLGVTMGGVASFVAARSALGQPLAKNIDNRWINLVLREFNLGGWKFVAFARINPAIPTGPLNYILGLTSLSKRTFIWTSFVFLTPPSIAIAFIGDTLQTLTANDLNVTKTVKSVLIVSVAITFLITLKYAFKFIRKKGLK